MSKPKNKRKKKPKNKPKKEREHQNRFAGSVPGLAYLFRLVIVAAYWSVYGPEMVTGAIACQVLCDVLGLIVDSDVIRPLARKLRNYISSHIEISIRIGKAK